MHKERVVFITEDLSLPVDEGMKKFNHFLAHFIQSGFNEHRIYARMSDDNTINARLISGRTFLSFKLLNEILRFKPHLILYSPLSSGTLASFLRLFILKVAAGKCKTILVNLQRRNHKTIIRKIITLIRPSQIVVFSKRDFDYFTSFRLSAVFCRTGVDVRRFSPVSIQRKSELKEKYGFNINDKIILHAGHLNSGRNIEVLKFLIGEGRQVIIIGSTSTKADETLKIDLIRSGIQILDSYLESIEEIYQLSDIYVFPVIKDHSAIEFPLSVLEAMSCNLPVVTTQYGALPDFFTETECLAYFSDANEILEKSNQVLSGECHNRDLAERFSWDTVLSELINSIVINDTISDRY